MAHFADIIDQDHIVTHLQNALRSDKLSHAYIISGDAHSGKRMIADIFAETILCENRQEGGPLIEPCGECSSCNRAESMSHPDIRIIERDKKASLGVDVIREKVCDDVYIKPYSDHKVYIIPEGELMTVQAQNALLKTLEEPPAYTVIIILTTNVDAFLPTIVSRCIVLPIKPVRDDLIETYLVQKRGIADYRARLAVPFARGNIGRAILLSENEDFEKQKNLALDLVARLDSISVGDIQKRLNDILIPSADDTSDEESEEGQAKKKSSSKRPEAARIEDFLDVLTYLVRDMLVYKASGSPDNLIFADKLSYISSVTEKCSYKSLNDMLGAIDEAGSRIRSNVNTMLTLEMLMLKIKEAQNKENL